MNLKWNRKLEWFDKMKISHFRAWNKKCEKFCILILHPCLSHKIVLFEELSPSAEFPKGCFKLLNWIEFKVEIYSSLHSRIILKIECFSFQNFKSIPHIYETEVGKYGGSVALADYCPYIQEFTWRSNNVVVRGSHCMYEENNPSKYFFKIAEY